MGVLIKHILLYRGPLQSADDLRKKGVIIEGGIITRAQKTSCRNVRLAAAAKAADYALEQEKLRTARARADED